MRALHRSSLRRRNKYDDECGRRDRLDQHHHHHNNPNFRISGHHAPPQFRHRSDAPPPLPLVVTLSLSLCIASMACLQNRLIIVPSSISLYLFSLLFSQAHICMSSRTRTRRPTLNLNLNLNLPIADIHDLLPEYGFPKGIILNVVKSYSLSSVDGSFEIELEQPCYVQFDKGELIYYDKNIKGVLSYGSVSHVSGIQAKQLFLWVSVTGMDVDFNKGMIHSGVIAASASLDNFVRFFDVDHNTINLYLRQIPGL